MPWCRSSGARRSPANLTSAVSRTRSWPGASASTTTASTPAPGRSPTTSTRRAPTVPALTTIHRVLRRRGFVTPQPQKRPRARLDPLRVGPAQRDLAVRHDPLAPRGRSATSRSSTSSTTTREPCSPSCRRRGRHGRGGRLDLLRNRPDLRASGRRCSRTTVRSTPRPIGARQPASRSSWPHSASPSSTASPTTPRPKAKSSATTRRLKKWLRQSRPLAASLGELQAQIDEFVRYLQRDPSSHRAGVPTDAARGARSTRRHPSSTASRSWRTPRSDATRSTRQGASRCATDPSSTTSASAEPTRASAS